MSEGRQCDAAGRNCASLPAMRLYANADWTVPIERDTPVEYRLQTGKSSTTDKF
ncbi:hypothetical protein D3C81_2257200 [compost metagenome]